MVEMLVSVKSCCPGRANHFGFQERQEPKPDAFNSKLNQYFTRLTSPLISPCWLNFHYWDWWTFHFISWNTKHTQKCNSRNREETSTKSTKGGQLPLSPFSPFEKKTTNGLIVESWRESFVRRFCWKQLFPTDFFVSRVKVIGKTQFWGAPLCFQIYWCLFYKFVILMSMVTVMFDFLKWNEKLLKWLVIFKLIRRLWIKVKLWATYENFLISFFQIIAVLGVLDLYLPFICNTLYSQSLYTDCRYRL